MQFIEKLEGIGFQKIFNLYDSVGWSNYIDNPTALKQALENSTYFVALIEDYEIIALGRSLSDDVSIHYLQDIIVSPKYQRRGLGRKILEKCLERFKHVRTHMILTDDEEKQKLFYESLGYKNTKSLQKTKLNAFVKIKGVELS